MNEAPIEKLDSLGRKYVLTPARLAHAKANSKLYSGFKKGHGRLGNSKGSTGKHWKKTPKQLENSRMANLGAKNPAWRGGITATNHGYRQTTEYRLWVKAVKERDGHKCVLCNSTKRLEADHIKPASLYPELRFAIDNGRTLCHNCHRETDTYAGKMYKYNLNFNYIS